jgi:hypothetical protein
MLNFKDQELNFSIPFFQPPKDKTKSIRITLWIGAVTDLYFAIAMLNPKLWAFTLQMQNYNPDILHRMDMSVGASVWFGWTLLLIWASFKPIQRKMVLLITAIVIIELIVAAAALIVSELNTFEKMLPVFMHQVFLLAIFFISYLKAKRFGDEEDKANG